MNKKRSLQILAVTCVLAVALLSLYFMGVFRQGTQITETAQKEIAETGIFTELSIEPEAGILPGDILNVKVEILFAPARMEVDAKKIAEDYIQFRENSFQGCEEYTPAKLGHKRRESLEQIELRARFQCWIVEAKKVSLTLPIQHTEKENRSTSTTYLSKQLQFAALPLPQNPRPLAEHRVPRSIVALLLITLGAAAIFATVSWLLIAACLRKKLNREDKTAVSPCAYTLLLAKIREAIDCEDLDTAYDKMYHILILRDLETKDEHLRPSLESLKKLLRKVYENETLSQKEARDILHALESLFAEGGDAK